MTFGLSVRHGGGSVALLLAFAGRVLAAQGTWFKARWQGRGWEKGQGVCRARCAVRRRRRACATWARPPTCICLRLRVQVQTRRCRCRRAAAPAVLYIPRG